MSDTIHLQTSIESMVIRIVVDETGQLEVRLDSTFGELDIESLTFAEILMGIEDELGSKLNLEESFALERTATIEDLVSAVQAKTA